MRSGFLDKSVAAVHTFHPADPPAGQVEADDRVAVCCQPVEKCHAGRGCQRLVLVRAGGPVRAFEGDMVVADSVAQHGGEGRPGNFIGEMTRRMTGGQAGGDAGKWFLAIGQKADTIRDHA